MRIRRKYWFVPALALLGILLAAMHFFSKPKVRDEVLVLDPNEPAAPLPQQPATEAVPAQPVTQPQAAPVAPAQPAPAPTPAPAPAQP